MGKVYLVMVGEYSDRQCEGWCSTEEEARRICAANNSAGGQGGDLYDIEECECLDGTVDGDVCVGWSRVFEFVKTEDGWMKRWNGYAYLNSRHAPVVDEKVYRFRRNARSTVNVRVWRKDEDVAAAQKAALDALYEYLAQKEGGAGVMMSVWHLFWVVPVSAALGFLTAGLLKSNGM